MKPQQILLLRQDLNQKITLFSHLLCSEMLQVRECSIYGHKHVWILIIILCLDEDKEYSVIVIEVLRTLRQKLKNLAKVTVDNENLDCSGTGYPRCQEFPPKDSFHFLVIEDA